MTSLRLVTPLLVVLACMTLAVSGAVAGRDVSSTERRSDGKDVAGPLDIAAVSVRDVPARRGRRAALVLRLRTHGGWAASTLSAGDRALNYLAFEFDRGRRPVRDRCLEVRVRPDGKIAAQMKGPVCAHLLSRPIGRALAVKRLSPRSIQVALPRSYLDRRPRSRRLRAASSFEAPGHPQCAPPTLLPPERSFGTCRDVTGWVALLRPASR